MKRDRLLLVVAVVAVSWSAPLIRLARDVPPLAISFWRNFSIALVLAPFVLIRHRDEIKRSDSKDFAALSMTGLMLAVHFATWVASVNMTSVASSVLLVASTPVFVAIGSFFIGDRPARRVVIGIAIAVVGGSLVTGGDLGAGSRSMAGDGLAIAGAIAATGYLIMGRRLRTRYSVLTYAMMVYGSCSIFLAGAMVLTHTSFLSYRARDWFLLALMAIGPQLLGHTIFNLLLKRIDATRIAVAVMGEPVISALIAALVFGELPGVLVIPGGVLLLAGIGLSLSKADVALVGLD
ncbi:MAG: DMT family transporter [Actinobacteria bacterium]|nr:DMT family transporter [Actinomycetota bacterium]